MGYVTGFTARKKRETDRQRERAERLREASETERVTTSVDRESGNGRAKRKQAYDELSQGHRKRVKHKTKNILKKHYQDSRGGNDRPKKRKKPT